MTKNPISKIHNTNQELNVQLENTQLKDVPIKFLPNVNLPVVNIYNSDWEYYGYSPQYYTRTENGLVAVTVQLDKTFVLALPVSTMSRLRSTVVVETPANGQVSGIIEQINYDRNPIDQITYTYDGAVVYKGNRYFYGDGQPLELDSNSEDYTVMSHPCEIKSIDVTWTSGGYTYRMRNAQIQSFVSDNYGSGTTTITLASGISDTTSDFITGMKNGQGLIGLQLIEGWKIIDLTDTSITVKGYERTFVDNIFPTPDVLSYRVNVIRTFSLSNMNLSLSGDPIEVLYIDDTPEAAEQWVKLETFGGAGTTTYTTGSNATEIFSNPRTAGYLPCLDSRLLFTAGWNAIDDGAWDNVQRWVGVRGFVAGSIFSTGPLGSAEYAARHFIGGSGYNNKSITVKVNHDAENLKYGVEPWSNYADETQSNTKLIVGSKVEDYGRSFASSSVHGYRVTTDIAMLLPADQNSDISDPPFGETYYEYNLDWTLTIDSIHLTSGNGSPSYPFVDDGYANITTTPTTNTWGGDIGGLSTTNSASEDAHGTFFYQPNDDAVVPVKVELNLGNKLIAHEEKTLENT